MPLRRRQRPRDGAAVRRAPATWPNFRLCAACGRGASGCAAAERNALWPRIPHATSAHGGRGGATGGKLASVIIRKLHACSHSSPHGCRACFRPHMAATRACRLARRRARWRGRFRNRGAARAVAYRGARGVRGRDGRRQPDAVFCRRLMGFHTARLPQRNVSCRY